MARSVNVTPPHQWASQSPARRAHSPHPSLTRVARRLALVLLVFGTEPVAAQEACFPRDLAVAGLGGLSEKPIAIGAATDAMGADAVVEVFAGPAGGFTILMSGADGFSCILARGDSFALVKLGAPS